MEPLYLLDLLGTAAFAVSGALTAVRHRMDLLGVVILGMVTATGGGTLRDLLLGATPPFCLTDETYLWLSLGAGVATFFLAGRPPALSLSKGFLSKGPLLLFDAVGLGTFVVIGTGKGIEHQLGFFSAVLMGVMTATAGGLVRDVLANEVPFILRREIYATACIAGGVALVLLLRAGAPPAAAAVTAALLTIAVRLLAVRFDWSLPLAGARRER